MQIEIHNCNNIDTGSVVVKERFLNIKYAMNGTGKSTIARAIELQIKGDGSIKELTPFKSLGTTDQNLMPSVSGLDGISSIAIFNDAYINQFAFKQDEVLINSFEIFVKSPDYDKHLDKIESLVADIKNTFRDSKEIDQFIGDLSVLSESFGKSKSGYSEAGALAKGIGRGNKVVNIPKGLESYAAYLKSSVNAKWLRWQSEGNSYSGLSESCPYCTSPIADKKEVISKVAEEYDSKSIEHLNKIISVVESLGRYLSEDAKDKIVRITNNINGLSKEEKDYLLRLKTQVETLKSKLLDLKGLTYFSMKDAEKVSVVFENLKINLSFLSDLDSESTREIVDKLNFSLDAVLSQIGVLQGEVAMQNRLIRDTIEQNKNGINSFLKYAGYKYHVDVEYTQASYRMRLLHDDHAEAITNGSQHLSYGERNAFSLVLFMYECLSKNPDLIILDDPISSFDRNKKYAVVDMLFRGGKSLRDKTVIMMTHDLEPVVDIVYTMSDRFAQFSGASFLELRSGVIKEIQITRSDISTFGKICDDNIRDREEDVVKLVYLRRHYEIINNKGLPYQLLSNLLHKREKPYKKEDGGEILFSAEEIVEATKEIQKKMTSFNYEALLEKLSDTEYMKGAFRTAQYNYEKLQIFRVFMDVLPESAVIRKYINEAFHIENEYIMQINPCTYEIVPSFIIDECQKLL